ncbi:hypothetical protein [Micromonospora inyonensis]|uniref:Uncharacterized protein n=1 Tax=Micromonospora inyonensis TaxID=47866 RepID=A0A1C6S8H1_9ACTN|nr:hypothetical protein [Micromonospora inyonensis]SCL25777.1 hypothetical protein GA0074694_4322 [Micromonospora inyonensis]
MEPEAYLTLELGPDEVGAETVKTVVLPWSGHAATVRVPAGTVDGSMLRLPGLGPAGPDGSPQDAYVRVRVNATPAQFGPPPQFGPLPGPPQHGPPVLAPAQPARRRTVLVAAAAVVAVLVCCGLPLAFFLDGDDEDGAPVAGVRSGAPSVAPSPSAAPMTPDQYQTVLTSTDQALTTGFRTLAAAKSPTAVRTAASNLATTAGTQHQALDDVVPPASVATAHDTLVDALDDLAAALTGTGTGTSGRACLGPAAVARVSRETAADQLRAAAQALATADPTRAYQVGSFVPKETKDGNRRLGNGSYVKRTKGGLGQLKIDNGGADAVISIVRGKTAVTRVYVRSKSTFTVRGVRDGTYQIFMTSGKDWDARNKAFSRDCDFEKFDDPLTFSTTSRTYTSWTLSLTPVVGGNASTSSVDPDQFPGG